MREIPKDWKQRLISIEEEVKYDDRPSSGPPFVITKGDVKNKVLFSAPHGARSFRNSDKEIWHEEDEYTAGLAHYLHEILGTHSIATIFKSDKYDPNYTGAECNDYKRALKKYLKDNHIKYVIDLHGAALHSKKLAERQLVDLGVGGKNQTPLSIKEEKFNKIREIIETRLGENSSNRRGKGGFDAEEHDRTITNFCYQLKEKDDIDVSAIQIEMKPQIRVVKRRESATLYKSCGEFKGEEEKILETIKALSEIADYLNGIK